MRSRLEADVARYFDKLKITWEYEPIRFQNETESYLPDFKIMLGEKQVFIEVKPCEKQLEDCHEKMKTITDSIPNALLAGIVGYWDSKKQKYELDYYSDNDQVYLQLSRACSECFNEYSAYMSDDLWVHCPKCQTDEYCDDDMWDIYFPGRILWKMPKPSK